MTAESLEKKDLLCASSRGHLESAPGTSHETFTRVTSTTSTHASFSTCEMGMPLPDLRAGSGRNESRGGAPGTGLASRQSHPLREAQSIGRRQLPTVMPTPPGTEHIRRPSFPTRWQGKEDEAQELAPSRSAWRPSRDWTQACPSPGPTLLPRSSHFPFRSGSR